MAKIPPGPLLISSARFDPGRTPLPSLARRRSSRRRRRRPAPLAPAPRTTVAVQQLFAPALIPYAPSVEIWPAPSLFSAVALRGRRSGGGAVPSGLVRKGCAVGLAGRSHARQRHKKARGWSMSEVSGNGQAKSLKGQIVGLIYATQFLRMPLIALNVLIIVVKLVSG